MLCNAMACHGYMSYRHHVITCVMLCHVKGDGMPSPLTCSNMAEAGSSRKKPLIGGGGGGRSAGGGGGCSNVGI